MDPMHSLDALESPAQPDLDVEFLEIAERVASVERVPRHILPPGSAREALTAIATAGYDCHVYASGGETIGTWCVWLGPSPMPAAQSATAGSRWPSGRSIGAS